MVSDLLRNPTSSHRNRRSLMRHLYSIYAEGEADAAAILKHIVSDRSASASAGNGGTNGCLLAMQYDPTVATWRIDLLVSELTQELAGSCWDALITVHLSFPRDVWLCTYDAVTITRVAPARARTVNSVAGYVLRPMEFDLLLELPAG